jgi:hypothetical protein
MADVQVAVGLGWEAGLRGGDAAAGEVVADDGADEDVARAGVGCGRGRFGGAAGGGKGRRDGKKGAAGSPAV